jgi:hypothetical protein
MFRTGFLTGAVLLAVACSTATPPPATAPASAASFRTARVELYRFNGQFVANVGDDAKPVMAWVRGNEAGYTEDKKPIVAVAYTGSRVDNGISIEVSALANPGNATKEEELTRVPVGTYRIAPGQSQWIQELSKFGMPPMLLRSVVAQQ